MLTHLLFMRHAKSSWKDSTLSDHARPLNKRGHQEADIIARTLSAKGLAPDIIWSSDAARTQETAQRLISLIPGAQTIIKVPEFYHASPASVLEQCTRIEEPAGKLMLLGHNPGWSELAQIFTKLPYDMPTAGCVVFKRISHSHSPWIAQENWRVIDQLNTKDLLADINSDNIKDSR